VGVPPLPPLSASIGVDGSGSGSEKIEATEEREAKKSIDEWFEKCVMS